MKNTVLGIALTIIVPFAALGLAAITKKLKMSSEGSRKLVHILLSNWILLAFAVYDSAWTACIIPACFIVLNFWSYKKSIFTAIERGEDNTPGTVWYAVSLFLLVIAGYILDMPFVAAGGMLAMGYGDGLGAIVGRLFGKMRFPYPYVKKSVEGTTAVALFSGLAVFAACMIYLKDMKFALCAAMCCALPAAVTELFSPRGTDNLTLPLTTGLIIFLAYSFPFVREVFYCLSAAFFVLLGAYYMHAITVKGFFAASVLGAALFVFGGWLSFLALVMFFILGSIVTHIGKAGKMSATKLHEHSGARGMSQVAANGLPALIMAVSYFLTGMDCFLAAVIACFAGAAADTFSSEIGMLSKKPPVSIINFKPIKRGLSGGVTPLGVAAGFVGALLLSLTGVHEFGLMIIVNAVISGMVCSIVDSLLGAAIQAKYILPEDNTLTERSTEDGLTLTLAHGVRWINNNMVNFVSIFFCGMLSALLWSIF